MTHENECMATVADELEAMAQAAAPEGAAAALGGIFPAVLALVAALRAGDWKATALAIRDLLNALLGDGGDTIQFREKLATVLAKIG